MFFHIRKSVWLPQGNICRFWELQQNIFKTKSRKLETTRLCKYHPFLPRCRRYSCLIWAQVLGEKNGDEIINYLWLLNTPWLTFCYFFIICHDALFNWPRIILNWILNIMSLDKILLFCSIHNQIKIITGISLKVINLMISSGKILVIRGKHKSKWKLQTSYTLKLQDLFAKLKAESFTQSFLDWITNSKLN